jgi:hypothetical protein
MGGSLERALDFLDEVKLATVPMAVGSDEARAAAKDYANAVRWAQYDLSKTIDRIKKEFTPAQREKMWIAGDEENDKRRMMAQEGRSPPRGFGLDRLSDRERAEVEHQVAEANRDFQEAIRVGVVKADAKCAPHHSGDRAVGDGKAQRGHRWAHPDKQDRSCGKSGREKDRAPRRRRRTGLVHVEPSIIL